MLSYKVKIRTNLGSTREKVVQADSEAAAIELAKGSFPLHEKVWVEGEPSESPPASNAERENKDRIMELKRSAEMDKAKAKRTEGLIWFSVGAVLTIITFLFVRNAFIIAFGPVIWGAYIYKKADKRYRTLLEDRAAGLPFIER